MTSKDIIITKICTPMSKVTCLSLDTKIDNAAIYKILDLGFSRIPVVYSEEHPLIIGVLLVKSLLCAERNGQTIANLYKNGRLMLKAPIYVDTEVQLSKVAKAFEEG